VPTHTSPATFPSRILLNFLFLFLELFIPPLYLTTFPWLLGLHLPPQVPPHNLYNTFTTSSTERPAPDAMDQAMDQDLLVDTDHGAISNGVPDQVLG
jgi:hypothetical protein